MMPISAPSQWMWYRSCPNPAASSAAATCAGSSIAPRPLVPMFRARMAARSLHAKRWEVQDTRVPVPHTCVAKYLQQAY